MAVDKSARAAAERGHTQYRKTKVAAVRFAKQPTDAIPLLEIHRGDEIEIEQVGRNELRGYAETLAGTGVDVLVYSSDAVRRPFSTLEAALRQRPGDQLRAKAAGDPTVEEVLSTLVVTADGDLAAVISAYVYEDGVPVFSAEEFDSLLDSAVVADLRRAFQV